MARSTAYKPFLKNSEELSKITLSDIVWFGEK